MGNRAVITTKERGLAVHTHWNGGYDSVAGFLRYCELRRFRPPEQDCYGWARLCQVIANFHGGGLSVGIDAYRKIWTAWDNGVYVIEGWRIVDRLFAPPEEQARHGMEEMLRCIDAAQPEADRLGEYMFAESVPASEIRVGDPVWWWDEVHERVVVEEVAGIGEGVVNGVRVDGIGYTAVYGEDPGRNINNYIAMRPDEPVRVARRDG